MLGIDTVGTVKSSTGLGSGLEFESLVDKIVKAESKPKADKLLRDEKDTKVKINSFAELTGTLSEFNDILYNLKDASTFQLKKTQTTNDSAVDQDTLYLTTVAHPEAINSTYTIEIRQLAQADQLVTNEFSTSSYVAGTGTLEITVGHGQPNSQVYTYTVDENSNTLEGIVEVINAQTASSGVSATLINSDSGSRLLVTTNQTGSKNALNITGTDELASLSFTNQVTAQDSIVRLNGTTDDITSSSNTLSM